MLLDASDEGLVDNGDELLRVLQERRLGDLVRNPLVYVDESVSAGLAHAAPGFVEHLAFLLDGDFVVVEPEPLVVPEPPVVPAPPVDPDEEPELVPLADTLPATTTVPPNKFTPPLLPPALLTEPAALIVCAVAVT